MIHAIIHSLRTMSDMLLPLRRRQSGSRASAPVRNRVSACPVVVLFTLFCLNTCRSQFFDNAVLNESRPFIKLFDYRPSDGILFTGDFTVDNTGRILLPSYYEYRLDITLAGPRITILNSRGDSLTSIIYYFNTMMTSKDNDKYRIDHFLEVMPGSYAICVAYTWDEYPYFALVDSTFAISNVKAPYFSKHLILERSTFAQTRYPGFIYTTSDWDSLLVYNMNGSLDSLWTKRYYPQPQSSEQVYKLVPYSVLELANDGYIIGGAQTTNNKYPWNGPPRWSTLLLRIDGEGREIWRNLWTGEDIDAIHSVVQAPDGNILAAGQLWFDSLGYSDPGLACYDTANGKHLWQKGYGYGWRNKPWWAYETVDYFSKVRLTRDGGLILAGCVQAPDSSAAALMVKTDIMGNEQWRKTFSFIRENIITDIRQTEDGGYLMMGTASDQKTYNVSSGGFSFVIKTDSLGYVPTSIEPPRAQADGYRLSQNYPNPVGPGDMRTAISWSVPGPGPVRVVLMDALGRTIRTLTQSEVSLSGDHTEFIDMSGFPSGIYPYRLEAGGRTFVKAMMVVR
jgi:hypothetical protein